MIVTDLPGRLGDLRESIDLAREAAEQVVEEIQDNGAAVAAPDDLDELRPRSQARKASSRTSGPRSMPWSGRDDR